MRGSSRRRSPIFEAMRLYCVPVDQVDAVLLRGGVHMRDAGVLLDGKTLIDYVGLRPMRADATDDQSARLRELAKARCALSGKRTRAASSASCLVSVSMRRIW